MNGDIKILLTVDDDEFKMQMRVYILDDMWCAILYRIKYRTIRKTCVETIFFKQVSELYRYFL